MPNFVAHICRNKNCNAIWIDKDLTHVTSVPPKWKYCKSCAEKLGIDYNSQTPDSNLTEKELENKNNLRERFKKAKEKANANANAKDNQINLFSNVDMV